MPLAWPSRRVRPDFTVPEFFWVAAIILAPLDAVLLLPYTVLGMHLSLPRLAVLVAVAISVLAIASTGRVRPRTGNITIAIYLLWLSWNFASGLWAVSQVAYVRYLFLAMMNGLLLMATVHLGVSMRKFDVTLKCIWGVVLCALAFGAVELVTGYRVPASRQWAFHNEITSLFVNPSHFGGALAMFAPFALMYPVWLSRLRPRVTAGAAVVLVLSAYFIVLSGSRGAVLSLVLGCATASILSLFQRRGKFRLTGLAVVLAVLVLLAVGLRLVPSVPEVLVDKLATLGDPVRLLSDAPRLVLWKTGWQLWTESPIVGWGAGASEFLLMERTPWFTAYSLHAWDIETLVNTGVVGSALWAVFVLTVVAGLLKRFWRSGEPYTRFVTSSLLGGMVGNAVISLTVGSLMTFPLFWVHLGLCTALASRRAWAGSGPVQPGQSVHGQAKASLGT